MNDAPASSSPFRLLEIGQAVRPAAGEMASGDAVLVQRVGAAVTVAVVDALGHGEAGGGAAPPRLRPQKKQKKKNHQKKK
jgi:hypothetical protein